MILDGENLFIDILAKMFHWVIIMEFKLAEGWGRVDFQIDSNSGCGIFLF